ncbi:hypothetical protein D5S17_35465 [Pseudonocardiaceae bacterium YIM PH 21723]|nr:hypothetical protein D5S17_35465 [Pseudonocardiaceae bacterium YIM PH 21723]
MTSHVQLARDGQFLSARLIEAADGLAGLAEQLRGLAEADVRKVGASPTAMTGSTIAQRALQLITAELGNLPLAAIARAGTEYDRALTRAHGLDNKAE